MFKHILIPTDGSELADQALENGLAFAASVGARVTVLTVAETFHIFTAHVVQVESSIATYESDARAHADTVLARAKERADALGVGIQTEYRRHDHPFQAIIDTARENGCDLIAMASHGRRGVAAVVMGSQAVKVLTHSDIPVLVYR